MEVEAAADFSHVTHRHTLGDADDQRDFRFDGLENRVAREGRWYVDDGYVGAVLFDGFGNGVADGTLSSQVWPPLPGVTPATTLVP